MFDFKAYKDTEFLVNYFILSKLTRECLMVLGAENPFS